MDKKILKTEKEIIDWLDKYHIKNYTLIPDEKYGFVVDVNNNIDLYNKNLDFIPVKFNDINGVLDCSYNELISLDFCPIKVNDNFYCNNNKLTTLKFCPNTVGGCFDCSNNKLTSLEFCPQTIGGNFNCYYNPIKNHIYFPEKINGDIWLNYSLNYTFEEAYKIHIKDKIEYEKQLLNETINLTNNVDKNNNSFKI